MGRKLLLLSGAMFVLGTVGCSGGNINPPVKAADKPSMMPPPGGPSAAGKTGGSTAAPAVTEKP